MPKIHILRWHRGKFREHRKLSKRATKDNSTYYALRDTGFEIRWVSASLFGSDVYVYIRKRL